MHRRSALSGFAAMLVAFGGCTGNRGDGSTFEGEPCPTVRDTEEVWCYHQLDREVFVEPSREGVPPETESVTFTLHNTTSEDLLFGKHKWMVFRRDDDWARVDTNRELYDEPGLVESNDTFRWSLPIAGDEADVPASDADLVCDEIEPEPGEYLFCVPDVEVDGGVALAARFDITE